MLRSKVFAVLGAGAGGQAIAGLLSLNRATVRVWNRSANRLAPLVREKNIRLEGAVSADAALEFATGDLGRAVSGAHVIMIVMPATGHWSVASKLAPFLEPGQMIVLNPGRTGGALEVKRAIQTSPAAASVLVAEAQTLLVASRLVGAGRCRIFSVKKSVGLSAIPNHGTVDVLKALNPYLPQFYPSANVLETGLDNMGAIFHPGVTLLNSARIESEGDEFDYYHQGVTPSVARVMEAVDRERVSVARSYGVRFRSARRWLNDAYDAQGESLYEAVHQNWGYTGIKAPETLDTRYLWEDVPTSLVPISELGRLSGVPTPVIDATISLCSVLHAVDYRDAGRNASRMGIEGLSPEEVIALAQSGKTKRRNRRRPAKASDDGRIPR